MDINYLIHESHKTAVEKGWWDRETTLGHLLGERPVGDIFMNIIAEVAEAWEEYRKGKSLVDIYEIDGKPEGIPVELADVLIRIFDLCGHYQIPLNAALSKKLEYNKTRPYRHGDKLA